MWANRKIKAFTLIELVVVMVISGILITISYLSFFIISTRFSSFSSSSLNMIEISNLNMLLTKDFDEATQLILDENRLVSEKDSQQVTYLFNEESVLRQQLDQVDTFKVVISDLKFFIQDEEFYLSSGWIDEVEFTYEYNQEFYLFHCKKMYSAEVLMKQKRQ